MKVLIQYSAIPETVTYAIVDLTKNQLDELKIANGVYVNFNDTSSTAEASRKISEALCDNGKYRYIAERDGFGEWFGKFAKNIINMDNPELVNISDVTYIICTGVYL